MTQTEPPPMEQADIHQNQPTPDGGDGQSHLIGKILTPALRLWLRSQVEQVEALQVRVEGGDRQLLAGHIARVAIEARRVVYQGLYLSDLSLWGGPIRVNLGQVLRGKPLTLLQPVPVQMTLTLHEADLNASLASPLLANALTGFLHSLLASAIDLPGNPQEQQWQIHQMAIAPHTLTLVASLSTPEQTLPVIVRTGLSLAQPNQLQFDHPQYLVNIQAKRGLPLTDLHGYTIDLGTDVALDAMSLDAQQLTCRGRMTVTPAG